MLQTQVTRYPIPGAPVIDPNDTTAIEAARLAHEAEEKVLLENALAGQHVEPAQPIGVTDVPRGTSALPIDPNDAEAALLARTATEVAERAKLQNARGTAPGVPMQPVGVAPNAPHVPGTPSDTEKLQIARMYKEADERERLHGARAIASKRQDSKPQYTAAGTPRPEHSNRILYGRS